MRILHINDYLDWVGGIETYLLSTVAKLREAGHEQAAVFAEGKAEFVEQATIHPGLKDPQPRARAAAREATSKAIAEFKPDVIHVHNTYNTGAMEAAVEAAPTILGVHDFRYLCPASSFYFKRPKVICERTCGPACFVLGPIKRCLTPRPGLAMAYYDRIKTVQRLIPRFAAVNSISTYVARRLEKGGFPKEKINIIPYFCPLEPVAEPPSPPAKPRILYIARLTDYKGPTEFIEALGHLPEDVEGVMIGNLDDQLEAQFRGQAERAGCADRLSMRPWAKREEIRDIMAGMSVVVFPSICPETLGLVGMESMSTGVPVVGFGVGGMTEWLKDGENGYAVKVKDTRAMAERIDQIIRDPELRARFGRNGIQLIRDKFSPDYHMARLEEIYEGAKTHAQ